MKIKLHLKKRIVDMERPKNNRKEEKEITVSLEEPFERDFDLDVFKISSARPNQIVLAYDKHYTVKNEHRAYNYQTTLTLNEPKELTSMWGKDQTTYIITYLGFEEKTLQDAIEDNPAESFKEEKKQENRYENLDDVIKDTTSQEE